MSFEAAYQDQANADIREARRVDRAAAALIRAAGRPELLWWEHLTEHERDGWRHMARVVLNTYRMAA